jgi:hypothetical protein
MNYIRAMAGIHTSRKHFLPYIQKHTSIVRFTARSLNSGDRIHNVYKELKQKKRQSGNNFVNNVSLPKQILFQHLSDILNDIKLDADDSGDLSLFEQYRQSGLVAIVVNGEIVVSFSCQIESTFQSDIFAINIKQRTSYIMLQQLPVHGKFIIGRLK